MKTRKQNSNSKTMSVNPLYHKSNVWLEQELSWIQRAQKDPACFAPLYKEYHEQIFRYIFQRMDDEDLAFDVTSQVFMRLSIILINMNTEECLLLRGCIELLKVNYTKLLGIRKQRGQ